MTTVNFALPESSTTQNSIGIISVGSRIFLKLGLNLLFSNVFAENCMKMNEIGPRGGSTAPSPRILQCLCKEIQVGNG